MRLRGDLTTIPAVPIGGRSEDEILGHARSQSDLEVGVGFLLRLHPVFMDRGRHDHTAGLPSLLDAGEPDVLAISQEEGERHSVPRFVDCDLPLGFLTLERPFRLTELDPHHRSYQVIKSDDSGILPVVSVRDQQGLVTMSLISAPVPRLWFRADHSMLSSLSVCGTFDR